MPTTFSIDAMVPGGIKASDHVHHVTNDGRCSRCRAGTTLAGGGGGVPLMLWLANGDDMLIYCEGCTGAQAWADQAPIAPIPH